AGGLQMNDSSLGTGASVFDILVQNGNLTSVAGGGADVRADFVRVETTGTGTIGTSAAAPLEINANTRFDATTASQNLWVVDTVNGFPIGLVDVGTADANLR